MIKLRYSVLIVKEIFLFRVLKNILIYVLGGVVEEVVVIVVKGVVVIKE